MKNKEKMCEKVLQRQSGDEKEEEEKKEKEESRRDSKTGAGITVSPVDSAFISTEMNFMSPANMVLFRC